MLLLVGVFLSFALGALGQLNPLGRFGKCINVPTVSECDLEGTWYLQYRNDNPDHYVHTCQAQYEQIVSNFLSSLLYYYNQGEMVNNPQSIKYRPVSGGKFYRQITTDGKPVKIYLNVLAYDAEKQYRVLYLCADTDKANPDIFNVAISTRDPEPTNLEEVLAAGKAKLHSISPKFDVKLMQVEQSLDKCAPLTVTKSAANPLKYTP